MQTIRPKNRKGMTLVEIMAASVVFAVAILGALGLLMFGLRTIDDAKALNQATQILMNEMESMRMRSWKDQTFARAGGTLGTMHGLKTMGTGFSSNGTGGKLVPPGGTITSQNPTSVPSGGIYTTTKTVSTFTPYAVYGVTPKTGKTVATLGDEVPLNDAVTTTRAIPVQIRAVNGFNCERTVELSRKPASEPDVNTAAVTLTISWTDSQGHTHSRFNLGYMSKNGINDYIYRTFPNPAN